MYTCQSQSPNSSHHHHHHGPRPCFPPRGVHTFVLYICVSISALQTSSSVWSACSASILFLIKLCKIYDGNTFCFFHDLHQSQNHFPFFQFYGWGFNVALSLYFFLSYIIISVIIYFKCSSIIYVLKTKPPPTTNDLTFRSWARFGVIFNVIRNLNSCVGTSSLLGPRPQKFLIIYVTTERQFCILSVHPTANAFIEIPIALVSTLTSLIQTLPGTD